MKNPVHQKTSHRSGKDPSIPQWAASNPFTSVWVAASAGTGKTKVLTDRVLRLLLPRTDGAPGTLPHRILCLTYTRAAAGEMTLRINKVLGQWAVMSDVELEKSLQETIGEPPTDEMRRAARRLFAQVVDSPGGLKIMTIHAFCQSILGRFPLEAGILPHMSVLDDLAAQEILSSAMTAAARQYVYAGDETPFSRLCMVLSDSGLQKMVQDVLKEPDQLADFFATHPDETAQIEGLREALKAPLEESRETLLQKFCRIIDTPDLHALATAYGQGAKTDQARGTTLTSWLAASLQERIARYAAFKSLFLTQAEEPKKAPTKGTQAALENAYDIQLSVAAKILALEDQIKAIQSAHLTHDLLVFSQEVQRRYQDEKERLGMLDYSDLILKTLYLLNRAQRSAAWVLYKLDDGLDHILLDEAQDTNPIQWDILTCLVEEFFNSASSKTMRTLFVVGDEKQSIYRFQGAALEEFQQKRWSLHQRAIDQKASWHNESLYTSFRSTRSVLGFVDSAFEGDQMRRDIGLEDDDILEHISHREGHAGRVELWPLIEAEEIDEREYWQLPLMHRTAVTPHAQLAAKIATKISIWLKAGRLLESKGRPVRPGDIMILVRRRSGIVDHLLRELKNRSIPVSGADRLIINEHIAVKDLLSAAAFALQPRDDLALAELLTSPFIGIEEQTLEDWCYERSGDLWTHVRTHAPTAFVDWLASLQRRASGSPFEFFFSLLQTPCPRDSVSGLRALRQRLGADCADILDEFMMMVQAYEREHVPHLQNFILWQTLNPKEIKKEQDSAENAVRIMTAHGAKGLQAPIVFMPDTIRTKTGVSQKVPRLLFPRRSGLPVPLWSPRKKDDCTAYADVSQKILAQETAEYKRLFYVAATRAEDELIICDVLPKQAVDEESWYIYAAQAFRNLGTEVQELPDEDDPEKTVQVYTHPQEAPPKNDDKKDKVTEDRSHPLPDWALQPAPAEPTPPRPLRPSRPSLPDPVMASPRQSAEDQRFRRGNLTHTLLQFLPDLPDDQRIPAGQQFLRVQAPDLSDAIQGDILHETVILMKNPAFQAVFSPQAQAEVAISGILPSGALINGKIDRLLITDTDILIVDYKTNRPPPTDVKNVPEIYRHQMKAYKVALQQAYPHHSIRCALVWTYGPQFMELSDL